MPTQGQVGFGVRLLRLNAANAYEDIGQIAELSGPALARDAVDASHSLSPNRFREFIGGMRDAGEISATLLLAPGAAAVKDHRRLVDDYKNDAAVTYRLLFPNVDQTSFTFTGLITSLEHAEPIDDKMTLSVTIKISGEPTLADMAP
jgi:predicted secreted protein